MKLSQNFKKFPSLLRLRIKVIDSLYVYLCFQDSQCLNITLEVSFYVN